MEAPHIAIVPSPGMGHLIPLAEFAKVLVSRFNFSVSLIIPSSTQPTEAQTSFLNSLPPSISHSFLPLVDPSLLPDGVAPEVTIHLTLVHSLPSLRQALSNLARRARVVALVTDLFGTDNFNVAQELGILPYMYFTTTAMCLHFLTINLPWLDETVSCEYRDMPDPLVLPGGLLLYGKDFAEPCMDRKDEPYRVVLHHVKRYVLSEGIFVNTFFDLEPDAIRALQTLDPNIPPIYPVGPIIQSGQGGETDGSECLEWLDQQPIGSVLYVSFGSGGTLSKEQLNELAVGLEKSGHRFLWVVRSPSDHPSGSFFTAQSQDDPFGFLPDGFLNRIKDRGLLVPSWAPQTKVLGHKSTGGFVTHCGWNSILESIINRIPLIVWPLYAEQRMNAVMLNQGIKVALRPNASEHGLVQADEIAKVVKELMEGEQGKRARHRMEQLSELAKKAISEDGDSAKLLAQAVHKWSHGRAINE